MLYGAVNIRRFGHDGRYKTLSVLIVLFVYLVWFQSVLLIVDFILCYRLQGWRKSWIVGHPKVNNIPIQVSPAIQV